MPFHCFLKLPISEISHRRLTTFDSLVGNSVFGKLLHILKLCFHSQHAYIYIEYMIMRCGFGETCVIDAGVEWRDKKGIFNDER